jgi:hypothetical protein
VCDRCWVTEISPVILSARAEENSPNGTVVAYIGVVDKDTGNNGLVSCSLTDDTFRLSKLASTENEYKVLVSGKLSFLSRIWTMKLELVLRNGVPAS